VEEASAEEENKTAFKLIYQSNVKNVSGIPVVPGATLIDKQRTNSFHGNLNGDEFKKESKGFLKKMQQLSTTQKFFNRKQELHKKSVKKPKPAAANPRLTQKEIDHLQ
jgi:hypothetical protein